MNKECIKCGRIEECDENSIVCCCGFSMFIKEDLNLLMEAGWKRW